MTLQSHETFNNNHSVFNISADEDKIRTLFDSIDFGENGIFEFNF